MPPSTPPNKTPIQIPGAPFARAWHRLRDVRKKIANRLTALVANSKKKSINNTPEKPHRDMPSRLQEFWLGIRKSGALRKLSNSTKEALTRLSSSMRTRFQELRSEARAKDARELFREFVSKFPEHAIRWRDHWNTPQRMLRLRQGLALLFLYQVSQPLALWIEKKLPNLPIAHRTNITTTTDAPHFSIESIISRNLFSRDGLIPEDDMPNLKRDPSKDPAVRSSLPMNLLGTIIFENTSRSVATLQESGSNLIFPVQKEDEIPGKIKITTVERNKCTFINLENNRLEYIDLPEGPSSAALQLQSRVPIGASSNAAPSAQIKDLGDNRFQIAKTDLQKSLQNPAELLTQARAVPNMEGGVQKGFKIFQIVPGSLYSKLGIQDNDVILGVNGEPMNDPGKALQLMQELTNSSHVELKVSRAGKESVFQYDINN